MMKLRILLGFVQIITRMQLSYSIELPPAVVEFFRVLSFVEILDVGEVLGRLGCLFHATFITRVYLQTALALVILGVTLLWHVVAKKLGRLLEAADALNLALFFIFSSNSCRFRTAFFTSASSFMSSSNLSLQASVRGCRAKPLCQLLQPPHPMV